MSIMKALTEEDKNMAFQRANISSLIPGGTIVRITEPYYKSAVAILQTSFCEDEPLAMASGAEWDQEVDQWYIDVLKENVSLLVINKENNEEIMGLVVIKPPTSHGFKEGFNKNIKMHHVFAFCRICDDAAGCADDDSIHLDSITVVEKHRKKGIATKLVEAAICMAAKMEGIKAIMVGCSSNYSQRIFENLGFDCLYERSFDTYLVDGEVFFKRDTGEHKSMTVYRKTISP